LRDQACPQSLKLKGGWVKGWVPKSIVDESVLKSGGVAYKVSFQGKTPKDDQWFTSEIIKREQCSNLIKRWKKEKHNQAKREPINLVDDDEKVNSRENDDEPQSPAKKNKKKRDADESSEKSKGKGKTKKNLKEKEKSESDNEKSEDKEQEESEEKSKKAQKKARIKTIPRMTILRRMTMRIPILIKQHQMPKQKTN